MFRPNTVLVIGAGASAEVGLPTGSDLAEQIAGILNFQRDELTGQLPQHNDFVREVMNRAGPAKIRDYERAAVQMIRGMRSAESVDRYIDRFSDDDYIRTLGKAAIIKAIAFKERKSKLFADKGETIRGRSEVDDTWYWTFAKTLFDGVGSAHLENVFDGLSIICFNYDRCIEHYLTNELMRSYHVERPQAAELVRKLKIWHPYGTIAPLRTEDVNGVAYGENDVVAGRCFELSRRIRTFTEKQEDSEMLGRMRAAIHAAETVVFLGFAFLDQNLELVQPDGPPSLKWILGTGHGLPHSAKAAKTEKLAQWARGAPAKIEILDMKCAALLHEYRVVLSA